VHKEQRKEERKILRNEWRGDIKKENLQELGEKE